MDGSTAISTTEVLKWIADHILSIVIFLGLFVELTPIKINPISFISNILFKSIRAEIQKMRDDVKDEIEKTEKSLSTRIEELQKDQEKFKESLVNIENSSEISEMAKIRWETLEFSNTIENGQLHKRDEYRHILDGNIRYHELITKHNLTNGLFDDEYNKIKNHYDDFKDSTSVYF